VTIACPTDGAAHVDRNRPRIETPVIAAIALAHGTWAVPAQVEVLELNIPAIHGVGASRICPSDRYKEFSIGDVDFTPIPTVDPNSEAVNGCEPASYQS
jgi:4-hydroxyphenylpyruvate dioxygenase